MVQQLTSTFTSRIDHYEVKINKEPAEIYLEVLNVDTLQLYSYTIREKDITPGNKISFDKLYKYFIHGLEKRAEHSEFTITPEMKIVLFIILSESVVSSENFEYQLKELPFMSPEHLEKLQQRISDSPGLLPKNMMGALFAMTLANQQNSAERLHEFEEQLKETKDDLKDIKGDVSHIVKIGFKNLEANTKKILKDIQNEIKEIRQNPGVDHIPTEQNNHKLEETLRQIQEENRKLKQIHVHELQELREMLEKKSG